MKLIPNVIVALVVLFSPAAASAASATTDQSDIWWTSPGGSENGWGIQFVQRNSTIFATMFVYNSGGSPTWFVATMTRTNTTGFTWTGPLYDTNGPWFGAIPYNPSLFSISQVGTMTWTADTVTSGTLSYTVSGITVTKALTRQSLVNENYQGHFIGGLHEAVTSCANSFNNGTAESFGRLAITQSGTSISINSLDSTTGVACAYVGTLTQYGQFGDVAGSYSCTNGSTGTFDMFEMQVWEHGVNGRFSEASSNPAGCQGTGWFGGLTTSSF